MISFLQDWDDPTATFVQDDDNNNNDDNKDEDEDEERRDEDDVPDAHMDVLLRRARARGRQKRNQLVNEIANWMDIPVD